MCRNSFSNLHLAIELLWSTLFSWALATIQANELYAYIARALENNSIEGGDADETDQYHNHFVALVVNAAFYRRQLLTIVKLLKPNVTMERYATTHNWTFCLLIDILRSQQTLLQFVESCIGGRNSPLVQSGLLGVLPLDGHALFLKNAEPPAIETLSSETMEVGDLSKGLQAVTDSLDLIQLHLAPLVPLPPLHVTSRWY